MIGYDAWLERPYQQQADASEAYEAWCEANDLDWTEDNWDEFYDAMADMAEDAAVERWERSRDR